MWFCTLSYLRSQSFLRSRLWRSRKTISIFHVCKSQAFISPALVCDLRSGGALADLILSVNQQSTVLACHRRPTILKIVFARAYGAREPLKYFLRRKKATLWWALSFEFVNARSWSFPLHKTLVKVKFLSTGNWENVVFRAFRWS